MDFITAQKLNKLNQEFYARNAATFSSTRSHPWQGWERLRPAIEEASTILDVACGNMRFERFAQALKGEQGIECYCVDSCAELADELPGVKFHQLDIVELCIEQADIAQAICAPVCDLTVSFGFLHHIPGFEARCHFIDALVEKTAPGGLVAVSFWRFMEDNRLARKACAITEHARQELDLHLDENDFILGWQNDDSAYRYCHNFTDDEIDELVGSVAQVCELALRFNADGKNGALNTYVVLQKL